MSEDPSPLLERIDLFGARRRGLLEARRIPPGAPTVNVEIRRGPDRVDTFEQEVLLDELDLKITLQVLDRDFPPRVVDVNTTLGPDWLLIWYLWPGRPYEVGAFHDARGLFRGHYVNLIRPPALEGQRWVVDDLFLDVWVPASRAPVVLDRDELTDAVQRGWVSAEERSRVEALGERLAQRADSGTWPPTALRRWSPDLAPALRLRRASPGRFHAARLSGWIIAYGLYLMGIVSATSIGFAVFSDAFIVGRTAESIWKATVFAEAVLVLPVVLLGKLPATFWPRPALTDERSLFVATLASGLAVLALNDHTSLAGALLPVYGTLGLFSAIFAFCRARYDHVVPTFAIGGIIVTVAALVVLV